MWNASVQSNFGEAVEVMSRVADRLDECELYEM